MSQRESENRIEFHISGTLSTWLGQRTGHDETLSDIARRDLERYYDMLIRVLPTFSEDEALLLCQVLNGATIHQYNAQLLWSEVNIAIEEGDAKQWNVNGPCLVKRLRGLTPFECMAIEDAVERYWKSVSRRDARLPRVRLYAVGLVRKPVRVPAQW